MNLQDLVDAQLDLAAVPAVVAGMSVAGARRVAARGTEADSCFRIASLTKVFTSTALVRVMREQAIPMSTPAVELLPHLARDWHADRGLTVERLLGQVSGLRESVDAAAAAAVGDGPEALTEVARLVVRAGNGCVPGTRWSYYNGNYFVAGAILAALTGTSYETALAAGLLEPWQLSRTGFEAPSTSVAGRDLAYPRGRRPSGGLFSCVPDLLTLGEGLLRDRALVEEIRRPRTPPADPMSYGLGWALGPAGQMYLNGRLPGYRAAMLVIPDEEYVSVVLTDQEHGLPAAAKLLSDMQKPFTGQDVAAAIEGFAT